MRRTGSGEAKLPQDSEDAMTRHSLTKAMHDYCAAATALERWSFDETEVEVLRHNLRDARRRLTEHMDSIESSTGAGPESWAPGLACGVRAEACRTPCVRRNTAAAGSPDAAARGDREPCRVIVQRAIERRST
jgi:hypothetical protein